MTTATLRISTPLPASGTSAKPGFWTRLYAAFIDARMRAAMRELRMHRHLIPQDMLKNSGYLASTKDDGAYPFTR